MLPHPFFAASGPDGAFSIKDLPPGTYMIEAWHEKLGPQSQTVTVGAGERRRPTSPSAVRRRDMGNFLELDAAARCVDVRRRHRLDLLHDPGRSPASLSFAVEIALVCFPREVPQAPGRQGDVLARQHRAEIIWTSVTAVVVVVASASSARRRGTRSRDARACRLTRCRSASTRSSSSGT